MNRYTIAALTGIVLAAGLSAADAQTVVIQPQQETVIRKYVVEHQAPAAELPQGTSVEVGATLPDTVELQTIDTPQLQTQYDYVQVNGQTVIVDPQTRKVIQVIQ